MNNIKFKIKLSVIQYNYLLKKLNNYKKTKNIIKYILNDTKNNKNILLIEKEKFNTNLIYKQLYFDNNTYVGYDKFELNGIFKQNINEIFSIVNNTYGLNADTNFKLNTNKFEKYIDRVYAPFIKKKYILNTKIYNYLKFNDIKINIILSDVFNTGYFLELEYLNDYVLNNDKKTEIKKFLEYIIRYLFDINVFNIIEGEEYDY